LDKQYEQYCLADPLFYDSPSGRRDINAQAREFPAAQMPLPAGWRRDRIGEWVVCIPPGPPIPGQGWKIHVAACLDNAEDMIRQVWDYCVPRGVSFKFLNGRMAVLMRNAKYAPRQASGKVITIYPRDEAACELILKELDAELKGAPGPYILSDLRYGAGPLYLRYGGFSQRYCTDSRGRLVTAIEDPSGTLVPDPREPVFTMPDWVSLPEFLAPHLAARNAATLGDLPYEVTGALHFSNGGGVYTATDKRTGEQVILKEARPHAGLAADGSDAVARLRREHDLMARLSGLGIAPEVRGYFEVDGHHFLAEELIEGKPLNAELTQRYPLTRENSDPVAAAAAYAGWVVRICTAADRAARQMHERGVIFNDLHMFNIMVRPDETIAFIDFEAASELSEGRRVTVGNPGFVAPRDRAGTEVDTYSLACLRLALFLPLTMLIALDRAKAAHLAEVIAEHFPVPDGFLDQAVREIMGPAPAAAPAAAARHEDRVPGYELFGTAGEGEADWENLRDALVGAIRASATPDRKDRLFPGDVDQFRVTGGGLGIAHGTAGVLYALSEAAGVRVPEYEEWLIERIATPVQGIQLGLYDGLAGIAWTLARFGHTDAALRAARVCLDERWERIGSGLQDGLSGFALAMLGLADYTGEAALADAGARAAQLVAERVPRLAASTDRAAGLLHGASGPALMLLRLYERTGDPAYLDAAHTAITADLDRCVTDSAGALQLDDGWRTLPYVGTGSAGIGMVVDLFLAHRQDETLAEAAAKLSMAARSGFYVQAGLLNGRAGMVLYLAGREGHAPEAAAQAREQARRLAWHAVRHAGGFAFPGDMLFRLSMDLGTGTAGVLLGLAAALAPAGVALPFLGPAISLPGESPREPRELARR
jgi:tRNA A-37 threonylcarbamoyl transferase component Bud32